MDPEVKVEFIISGEVVPQIITDKLGLQPSRIWEKGDIIKNTKIVRKQNGWCLSSSLQSPSIDVESHIQSILDTLLPKANELVKLCKNYRLYSEFACSIDLIYKTPIINLSLNTLNEISKLKSGIDIDIVISE